MDWQISYEFGPPTEITPESPQPGYDKDGKRTDWREKAVSPKPEGSHWNRRSILTNDRIADTRPPLSTQGQNFFQGYDTESADPYPALLLLSDREEVLSFSRPEISMWLKAPAEPIWGPAFPFAVGSNLRL